jgi:N-acetylglucosamine-6-phosphate deacetylase
MATQVFYHGTLITDAGLVPDGMIVASDGRIDYAGPRQDAVAPPVAERIDAGSLYLSPGFLDMHVHGGAGSDFMDATREDVETVLGYHAAHGTTSFCATTATAPLEEILTALDAMPTAPRASASDACSARTSRAHI